MSNKIYIWLTEIEMGSISCPLHPFIPLAAAEALLTDLMFLNTSVIKQISTAQYLAWLLA